MKAYNFYESCSSFEFVVAFVIARGILSYISAVAELLKKI